jgi:hypothetical protein
MKFQGDIPYIAHVLNLIIQDILKALIKNNYDTSYTKDVYKEEKDDEDKEDSNKQNTSEFFIFF